MLILCVSRKWIDITISYPLCGEKDTLVVIRDVLEGQRMDVQFSGRKTGSAYLIGTLLSSDLLAFVIMLLNSLFSRQSLEADSRRLVVGNIHVLFNPNRGDVKLGQIRILLMKANALSNKWNGIPVVLSGDFNSTPDSGIYEFLSTSELDVTLHDRRHLSGQNKGDFLLYDVTSFVKFNWTNEELGYALGTSDSTRLRHPLHLRSSYASVKGNGNTRDRRGEPSATSSHSKFLGTVDYIWYSSGLVCSRVLDTLPVDTLRKLGGLPTQDIGSDHLALVSELVFTESVKKLMELLPDLTEKDDTLHGRLHPG